MPSCLQLDCTVVSNGITKLNKHFIVASAQRREKAPKVRINDDGLM